MRKVSFLAVALAVLVSAVLPPSASADISVYVYIDYYGCNGTFMGYNYRECDGNRYIGGYQGGAYRYVMSDNCHLGGAFASGWEKYEWEINTWVPLQEEPDWNAECHT
jgi:hypothetical protein